MYCRTHQPHSIHSVTWPRRLPVWPLGGAKFFFQTRFSRQPLKLFPKFFQGRVPPPEELHLSSGDMGVGVKFGCQAPKVNLKKNFLVVPLPGMGGGICRMEIIAMGDPFDVWNLKKIHQFFFEKIEFKVFEGGALCRVRPLGGLLSPPDPWRFWS